MQIAGPVGTSFAIPTDGVIVRWRIRTASGTGQWRIRTITDADGDGYGDETQDACPTKATTQLECVPLETTITKKPKKPITTQKAKRRVSFSFGANEQASLECLFDAKGFAPCSSPYRRKITIGKHKFAVRAVDSVGNVDDSPATARVKVKRRT